MASGAGIFFRISSGREKLQGAALSINAGDVLKISADDSKITLQKAEDKCVFCNGTDDLREFEGKFICSACRAKLSR